MNNKKELIQEFAEVYPSTGNPSHASPCHGLLPRNESIYPIPFPHRRTPSAPAGVQRLMMRRFIDGADHIFRHWCDGFPKAEPGARDRTKEGPP